MAVFDKNGDLKQDARDVLYELGNVGVGTAAMAIGSIREMEIRIDPPNVIAVKSDIFAEIDYDPEQVVVSVSTRMSDTLDGSILFLLSREFVRNTVYKMTEECFDDEELMKNEDSVSALREMINYTTAGYAKVIGSYLELPVYISSASVGLSKARNIVQDVIANASIKADKMACVNTKFTIVDEDGNKTDEVGQVLIFPDAKSIEKFIEIMRD
ncbi:MAG: hypothetical protein PHE02_13210 [Lachnospiraceae bacterium]|nr:hypothetical protein [Lachnospiraceae bacterium]